MNSGRINLILSVCLFLSTGNLLAQEEYWVFFKDKNCKHYDYREKLNALAVQRRVLSGFPVIDSADMPVNIDYLNEVEILSDSIDVISNWLNAVSIYADETKSEKIKALPFVKGVVKIKPSPPPLCSDYYPNPIDPDENAGLKTLAHVQLSLFVPQEIANRGLNGKGVLMAVIDAGFPEVGSHKAFRLVNDRGGIREQFDFVKKRPGPMGGHQHGMQVLSNICGMMDDFPLGFGTGADFLLARTEKAVGPFTKGEKYWWAAAEWAENKGAKIITTSLGYGKERYFQEELNGMTTNISKAARMAAQRGVLVIAAAGNEGIERHWRTLVSPADADSVLAVGGIDPENALAVNFASRGLQLGPAVKPNVSASAITVTANRRGKFTENMGTSFATPLVAGLAACYWQINPGLTHMQVFQAIERSGHLYPYYDLAHGYGHPMASKLFGDAEEPAETFVVQEDKNTLSIKINTTTNASINPYLGTDMLYYHLADENGKLLKYAVVKVLSMNPLRISLDKIEEEFGTPHSLSVHFRGYTYQYIIRHAEVPENK